MEIIKIKFTGISPLMMHSERGANPLDPDVKELKKISGKGKGKKTDEDYAEMARMDWQLGMYFDEKAGPYIPGINVRACVVAGGKMNKLGTSLQRGTTVLVEKIPLEYSGPRSMEKLWENSNYRDIRSVVVGQSRTMRCRPIFKEWSLTFDFYYDPSVIDKENVLLSATNAGTFIGLGDFRPGKGNGTFGRFSVDVV